jgi:hypothetical protein
LTGIIQHDPICNLQSNCAEAIHGKIDRALYKSVYIVYIYMWLQHSALPCWKIWLNVVQITTYLSTNIIGQTFLNILLCTMNMSTHTNNLDCNIDLQTQKVNICPYGLFYQREREREREREIGNVSYSTWELGS